MDNLIYTLVPSGLHFKVKKLEVNIFKRYAKTNRYKKKGQGKPYHLAQPKRSGVFILFVKMYPIKKVHIDNWSTLMANATLLVRKTYLPITKPTITHSNYASSYLGTN